MFLPALVQADPGEPAWTPAIPHIEDWLPQLAEQPGPSAIVLDGAGASRLTFIEPDSDVAARQRDLKLRSAAALVLELGDGQLLYAKNTDAVMPIASITKLMTAIVVLDSGLPLDEPVNIEAADVDTLKGTRSRLKVGMTLTRYEL